MKSFTFNKFLYGTGMVILVLGAITAFSAWREAESIAEGFLGILLMMTLSGGLAVFFIALAKILERLEKMVEPMRRTEERLEKLLRAQENNEEQ